MTALPTNIVAYQQPAPPPAVMSMMPTNIGEGMRLADMMATSRLVPAHLQKSPADCLLVIMQAMRWRMDPFAVAQATAVIQGKLMYEGKLVAAVVNSLGNLSKRLGYAYSGDGDNRTVTVSGTLVGEPEPLTVAVRLKDAKTNNKHWQTQPDQQLAYHGARVWARRYMPELMLGVYAPEEFDQPAMRDVTPPPERIDPPRPPGQPPSPVAKPAIRVKVPGQAAAEFSQDDGLEAALRAALEFMSSGILDGRVDVIAANVALLDRIAEKLPELATDVADLRAAAAMAEHMTPEDPEDTFVKDFVGGSDDDFPGTVAPSDQAPLGRYPNP